MRDDLGEGSMSLTADATDEMLAEHVIRDHAPSLLVLNAGAAPHMAPVHEQTHARGVWDAIRAQLPGESPTEPVEGAFAVATMACSAATWPWKAARPSVVRRARTRRLTERSTVT